MMIIKGFFLHFFNKDCANFNPQSSLNNSEYQMNKANGKDSRRAYSPNCWEKRLSGLGRGFSSWKDAISTIRYLLDALKLFAIEI